MPPPAPSPAAAPRKGFRLVKTNTGGQLGTPVLAAWGSPSFPSPATETCLFNCYICRKSDYESQCKLQQRPSLLQEINSAV